MATLATAIRALHDAVESPRDDGWGWRVRQRMPAVRSALLSEPEWASDSWLAHRASCVLRSRTTLLGRLHRLGRDVMASPDQAVDQVRRLLRDLEHHRQAISDLVYDSVELELGGSE